MKEIKTLLMPRLWSARNGGLSREAVGGRIRFYLFGSIGLIFWVGMFVIFYRVLKYFKAAEGFGDILATKLLSMVIVTFFSLLIFSSIITALSKLYLSRDLQLVHSMPVAVEDIFLARWFESTFDSAWMVAIFSLPVFLSYGIVYKAGILYYCTMVMTILPLCLISSAISAIIVMVVAVILPAGRIRAVFVFFGIFLFLLLVIAMRMMRPEQFVNPEGFSTLVTYFKSLETPGSPLLPTTWIIDGIRSALAGYGGSLKSVLFELALIWSCALTCIFSAVWIAEAVYFPGFSKTQTTPGRLFKKRVQVLSGWTRLFGFLSGPARAFAVKEIRTFLRDQTQWPQVFLIIALIIIYLYNFSVLPFEKSPIQTFYLQNMFSFLNMGLASFVLIAIAARFVYPAVSIEGNSFWIVKAAPIRIRTFLWIKFFVYYLPLLFLAEILTVMTNILLHVTPFMMTLSTITVFFMVPGIVALGIGLGAAYPDFNSENPAQSVTSFGGLLFMLFCAGFVGLVIVLEAGPVYHFFMSGVRGRSMTGFQWLWLIGSFTLVFLICIAAVVLPMRFGEKQLGVFK